tara:strand:+ start:53 stop:613 length:561 start_codon:yes stop_codon:yes gene_type:complete
MVKTKAAVFILPMIIGVPVKYFSGFANVFIGDSFSYGNILEDTERIFLVFKNINIEDNYYNCPKTDLIIENSDRIRRLKAIPQYINIQTIGSYTVFLFKPADRLLKDYNRFKEGKYSELSGRYKTIVKKHYPSSSRLKSIINPTDEDRAKLAKELESELKGNCEIFSPPYYLEEEFSYAKFLELEI